MTTISLSFHINNMADKSMYLTVLENTLKYFKELEDNNNLPSKYTMKTLNTILKEKSDELVKKNVDKPLKTKKKLTDWNIFYRNKSKELKDFFQENNMKTLSEKSKHIAELWKQESKNKKVIKSDDSNDSDDNK